MLLCRMIGRWCLIKASPRIWDSLGFTRAGLIPRAGRLRRADGSGEEWVDSIIYYRSFVDEEEWARPIDRPVE
jgi:hypothetical protein